MEPNQCGVIWCLGLGKKKWEGRRNDVHIPLPPSRRLTMVCLEIVSSASLHHLRSQLCTIIRRGMAIVTGSPTYFDSDWQHVVRNAQPEHIFITPIPHRHPYCQSLSQDHCWGLHEEVAAVFTTQEVICPEDHTSWTIVGQ